jgi:hypothetical protein
MSRSRGMAESTPVWVRKATDPMSYSIDPTASFNGSYGSSARRLMSSQSLGGMAKAMGVVAGGIALTAGYAIATEEGRSLLNRLRATRAMRRDRNSSVLCAMLATDDIPVNVIKFLEAQRDVFRAAIQLSIDPEAPTETKAALRRTLRDLYIASQNQA